MGVISTLWQHRYQYLLLVIILLPKHPFAAETSSDTNLSPVLNALSPSDVVARNAFQRLDFISQMKFTFSSRSHYNQFIDILHPIIERDLILSNNHNKDLPVMITILCEQPEAHSYLFNLFKKATDHQIVILYDRIMAQHGSIIQERENLIQKLYESVDDNEFRQLIDALRWGRPDAPKPSPPPARHIDCLRQIIPISTFTASIKHPILHQKYHRFQRFINAPFKHKQGKTCRWLRKNAILFRLSDPDVLLALLRCGIRFEMYDFLRRVKIDKEQLPMIFPLLTHQLLVYPWSGWSYYKLVNSYFLDTMIRLRERGHEDIAAAVLQLPCVVDFFRPHMEDHIKHAKSKPIWNLLDLKVAFVSELVTYRFGPERDLYLHWYCKKKDLSIWEKLSMIKKVSHVANFQSKNERGLVPFRCLKWSDIQALIRLDRQLASVMMRSDPDFIIAQNHDLILERGFEKFISEIDFIQAFSKQIPSSDLNLFWSLFRKCELPPPDRSYNVKMSFWEWEKALECSPSLAKDSVNMQDPYCQATFLHFAFASGHSYWIRKLLSIEGVSVLIKDRDGRVPFQYATMPVMPSLLCQVSFSILNNLIQTDVLTFVRLSLCLLKTKPARGWSQDETKTFWNAIQFLFDHVDMFVSCMRSIASSSL